MRKKLLILSAIVLQLIPAKACTTGIVSGRCTSDGRPLMFKQRDSSNADNAYVYSDKGKYAYIGVVPLKSTSGRLVVYGQNEKGLAIMNSTAYNLEEPVEGKKTKGNIIRIGLEQCATMSEFEALLNKMSPFDYGSNYGCMDADGNVAYFECGTKGVKKFDANDPSVAPHGYIVRTNFGFSGDIEKGKGYTRYRTASALFEKAASENKLNVTTLLSFSRCLRHGLTNMDLYDYMPDDEETESYMYFTDFIPRISTASCVVFQGVRAGENPLLTTSWTAISSPLVSVAVPVWFSKDQSLPKCVSRSKDLTCPLTTWGNLLKPWIWTMNYGECENYIMLSHLINSRQTGLLQQIKPVEDQIVSKGEALLEEFRNANRVTEKCREYYSWVDQFIDDEYTKIAHSHQLIP